jgi:DNA-binding transcriptional LysR family regulator
VALTLEECFSNDLIERLRSERMDVAFIRTSPADADGLQVHRLQQEPLVVALPAVHPLASRESGMGPISFRQLAGETFILAGPPGTGLYDGIIAACQAAGFNPRVGNLGASTGQGPRIASTLSLVGAASGLRAFLSRSSA